MSHNRWPNGETTFWGLPILVWIIIIVALGALWFEIQTRFGRGAEDTKDSEEDRSPEKHSKDV